MIRTRWKALSLAAAPAGSSASGVGPLAHGAHNCPSFNLHSASREPQCVDRASQAEADSAATHDGRIAWALPAALLSFYLQSWDL